MEILITSLTLLTLLAAVVLIATRGRPALLITAFSDTLQHLKANRLPVTLIVVAVLLVLGFVYFFYASPGTRIGPAQPIPFSHQIHAGVKAINCRFCHPYVARSNFPGLPPVEKCLYCHNYIITQHPQILKEHNYFNTNTPTPWRKAFYLPEHVLFNHQRHIRKEVQCAECHGKIETMDRIKGTRFKMNFCITCHRQRKVNLDCWLACHI